MTKNILLILSLLIFSAGSWAAEGGTPSKGVTITGAVEKSLTFTPDDLAKLPTQVFKNIDVYCQSGDLKQQLDGLTGVQLKTLIEQAGFKVSKHKDFRKIAFIAKATDDYWVTFSYGEIFNQETETPVMVYFKRDGHLLEDKEGAVAIMPLGDERMGGRQVKWLEEIEVRVLTRN